MRLVRNKSLASELGRNRKLTLLAMGKAPGLSSVGQTILLHLYIERIQQKIEREGGRAQN